MSIYLKNYESGFRRLSMGLTMMIIMIDELVVVGGRLNFERVRQSFGFVRDGCRNLLWRFFYFFIFFLIVIFFIYFSFPW